VTQHRTAHHILHITVRGALSDRVAAGFDGMQVAHRGRTTELVGTLVDQAQLHGLLTRVRDLGLDLESVLVVDRLTPSTTAPQHRPRTPDTPLHREDLR
jgi:hypothetical protein